MTTDDGEGPPAHDRVDRVIAEIDAQLSSQVKAIRRHGEFQRLERAWRSLKFVVDEVDSGENIKVQFVNLSKEDLLTDFEDSPNVQVSGFYKAVYLENFGVVGGQPVGLIVGDYEFDAGPRDIALLEKISRVAMLSHAPFVAASAPSMFGVDSWEELSTVGELRALFEAPGYAGWRSFRESDEASYVGLCLPRFDLNAAVEDGDGDAGAPDRQPCWASVAIALAARVAETFGADRWGIHTVNPSVGVLRGDLATTANAPADETFRRFVTDGPLNDRREFYLSEEGFIGMTCPAGSRRARFLSAYSARAPRYFGTSPEGRAAQARDRHGAQLPYLLVAARFAHCLKLIARGSIGVWMERSDLEHLLNGWLRRYVADMDAPAPSIPRSRPLRRASLVIEDVDGQPAWFRMRLTIVLHTREFGEVVEVSLLGVIEKG